MLWENFHECATTTVLIIRCHCFHLSFGSNQREAQLTGLSKAVQFHADSFGVDRHHGDGVFSVRGQLWKQDSSFLPSNLGLVGEEYMLASLVYIFFFVYLYDFVKAVTDAVKCFF